MRYLKTSIVMIALVLLSACATFSNRNAPENVSATPPAGSSIVVISTGAKERCFIAATQLVVAVAGSAYLENVTTSLDIDAYATKSDFDDHQGNINVLTLQAGDYELYPYVLNPYIVGEKLSALKFTVKAGEFLYVGEYFMDVACRSNEDIAVLGDREDRDLSLVRQRNPLFGDAKFSKRLARFSRHILNPEHR